MPKGPEEFKDVEKLKLSLLQLEKRFVDTELSVAEVKEKIKEIAVPELKEKIEALSALKERVEELAALKEKMEEFEDLIMLEQVGVMEIKKMMDEMKGKLEMKAPEVSIPAFEERIRNIEENIKSLSVARPPEVEGIQRQIQAIVKEITDIRAEMSKEITDIKGRIGVAKIEPGIDVQFLASKLDALKKSVDDILSKRVDTDLKIQGLEKSLTQVQSKMMERAPEKILEEMESNRKNLMLASARLDSVERVIKEISEDMGELEATIKKFESFEKLSLLGKEIEDKLARFKFVEDETRRMSTRIESMYEEIDKRFEKIKETERKYSEFLRAVSGIEEKLKGINSRFSDIESRMQTLNKPQIDELRKNSEALNAVLKGLNERINSLENAQKGLIGAIRGFEEIGPSMEKRLEEINKVLPSTIASKIKPLEEKISSLEKGHKNLTQLLKEGKPEEFKKLLEGFDSRIAQIERVMMATEEKYKKEMEGMRSLVSETIAKIEAPLFETQINELIDRLVFLESRLGAIERTFEESVKVRPVILE